MTAWIAVLFLLFVPADSPSQIEHSLRKSYEKQTRALRGYYSDSHLKFDTTGALVGTAHPGPWTLGYVTIETVKLTRTQLELRGKRVAARIESSPTQISYVVGKEDVRIDIAVLPASDESALRSAIERVFYPPNKIFTPLLPDYWQDLLDGNVVYPVDEKAPVLLSFRSGCPSGVSTDAFPQLQPSGGQKMVCGGVTIYRVLRGGVKPPQTLHADDPKYVEAARQSKFQGTTVLWIVVDETGHAKTIRIVRAIGMGLDDAAVETVQGWLFKPADLNGQPVAVEANVEVNFRLH